MSKKVFFKSAWFWILLIFLAFIFFVVRDLRDISDYLGIVPERFFCTKSEKPQKGGIVTPKMYVDRYNIERDYLHNIESLRRHKLYDRDSLHHKSESIYTKYRDGSGYSYYITNWPKTKRRDFGKEEIIYDRNIENYVKIFLDTLFYSSDSLLCGGLVIIEYPDFNRGAQVDYTAYDGYLLLGCRKDKNQKFSTYTFDKVSLHSETSFPRMSKDLKDLYFKKRKGGWIIYGLDDSRFFTNPIFNHSRDGHYIFQHHITSWDSVEEERVLYSNERDRNFHLPQDTTFIPYRPDL
ncbi:MAG: hypothetical protein K2K64_00110 [Muribaculaceae bacterium]|nr:hypothetical protein [Muribaculaceae bacterium]